MKQFFLLVLISLFCTFVKGQEKLVNSYSSYSEVYGGMQDGGISRSEIFIFVATGAVEIKDIFFESQKIILKKGDSLVVNCSKYIPYNNHIVSVDQKNNEPIILPEIEVSNRFQVTKSGHIYYANVRHPYVWPGTIEYVYKKRHFQAKIKSDFDSIYSGYAP